MSKTVFTNGCFDILHAGHVKLLEYCHSLAHQLFGKHGEVAVGLNSDVSVKGLKGTTRPINNELDRKYLLESLKFVDDVYIFNEPDPYNLLVELSPDILVKGGDYSATVKDKSDSRYVIGSDLCMVKIFDTVGTYSTTNTINEISSNRR